MSKKNYQNNIFINCSFDEKYSDLLYAKVFCIYDCGYIPRCSLELNDSSEVRLTKIYTIISECKFGIHDISRTQLSEDKQLPRFNMPFELGIFLGAKKFGHGTKQCLITDEDKYRYQAYISDIAGQDIYAHKNNAKDLINLISRWLREKANGKRKQKIPGGAEINRRYNEFQKVLPDLCNDRKITIDEMSYNDYGQFVSAWLQEDREKNLQ